MGDTGYKTSYVEAFGAILGTSLAVTGALWAQRKIDETAEREKIKESALVVYYDFDFAFADIIKFMQSYLSVQGKLCDHIEDLDTFRKEKSKYRIYIDDNWIHTVAKLSGVSEIKRIYELYGDLSTIKGIFDLREGHISEDDANTAYASMLRMTHQKIEPLSRHIKVTLKEDIKSILDSLRNIANIEK